MAMIIGNGRLDQGQPSAVVVFSREPVAGRTKTRLASGIGAEEAAEVHGLLLEHTLAQVRRAGLVGFVSLASRPTTWRPPEGTAWLLQRGADLGARLHDAFTRVLGLGFAKVLIIGSDCPELGAHHLVEALRALEDAPVVVGPASDGGYWLIGQRQAGWDLFSGVPWSSPATLDATRRRLRTLDLGWCELETLSDVDTADDLRRILSGERLERHLADQLNRHLGESQLALKASIS